VAFGQQSGPPASARQVRELLTLLHDAGHSDFRDARGPMGFTQRQAAGKFTGPEAAAFIDALTDELSPPPSAAAGQMAVTEREPPVPPAPYRSGTQRALSRLPAEDLAAELRRRGWQVTGPPDGPGNGDGPDGGARRPTSSTAVRPGSPPRAGPAPRAGSG
jgi:hypothetical protein